MACLRGWPARIISAMLALRVASDEPLRSGIGLPEHRRREQQVLHVDDLSASGFVDCEGAIDQATVYVELGRGASHLVLVVEVLLGSASRHVSGPTLSLGIGKRLLLFVFVVATETDAVHVDAVVMPSHLALVATTLHDSLDGGCQVRIETREVVDRPEQGHVRDRVGRSSPTQAKAGIVFCRAQSFSLALWTHTRASFHW